MNEFKDFVIVIASLLSLCFLALGFFNYIQKCLIARRQQCATQIQEAVMDAMAPHVRYLRQLESLRKFENDEALFSRFETVEGVAKNIPARFTTVEASFLTRHLALTEEATTTVGRVNELLVTVDSISKRVEALNIKVFGPTKPQRIGRSLVKPGGEGGADPGSDSASNSFVPPTKAR